MASTRRERIIGATIEVIAERGIAGLTHRAVAEAADVALGSTTYYFATLDDLLEAALARSADDYDAWLRAWATDLGDPTPAALVETITTMVAAQLTGKKRARTAIEFEVYVAAITRPRLRPLVARYTSTTVEVLADLTSEPTAQALTAAIDGLLLQDLTGVRRTARTRIRAVIAAILTPPPPPPTPAPTAPARRSRPR